ncbi:MAG: DUF6249 domain-containing protein [Pseudomonadales bacterium]
MPGELVPLIIVPAFFFMIAYIARLISDNRVRRELINSNADTSTIENLLLKARSENPDASLKWGIVSLAIGLALVLIEVMDLSTDQALTYGITFIFGGAGLLCFYMIKIRRGEEAI